LLEKFEIDLGRRTRGFLKEGWNMQALARLAQLRVLRMKRTFFLETLSNQHIDALEENAESELEILDVSGSIVDASAAERLCRAVGTKSRLRVLDLSSTYFAAAIEGICEVLRQNGTLETLNSLG
jgi:hypothetical protein